MTSRGLDGVRVNPSTLINKVCALIDGVVRTTLRVEIPVRYPAINDDRSAGFEPCIITVFKVSTAQSGPGKRTLSVPQHDPPAELP
jgi:hypothetical protein